MQILILGGFLGSGKTTALMQLARWLVARTSGSSGASGAADSDGTAGEAGVRVMILENEVGAVGIDDGLLRSGGFAVDTLFSGCACCTIAGELDSAARRIREAYDPAWLIIETTGIAYPRNMQENLWHSLGVQARIAVLTDAARWQRLRVPMNELLKGQIEGSDTVLVNKTDLVDEKALQDIERDVFAYEPAARIFRISATGEIPGEVWKAVTEGQGQA
ncbi:MAG: cobalamin biosynthesis protein P47K [Clostridiales Family XIII bacterium]|jgi:G3E family GTPase|nr:cobalamin biosynthesis protein P47K [Clostridiales Family XIII bacterium]